MKKLSTTTLLIAATVSLLLVTACKKEETTTTGVKDVDGNSYTTVKIGNQVWLKENLRVTKYRDGSAIPNVTDDTEWSNQTAGAYCDHSNNSANGAAYGKLYNWHAVNSGKLAPEGWHIPTAAEWAELAAFVGNEGGALKSTGTSQWKSPNNGATNTSGFTGLPGGYRSYLGTSSALTMEGSWWTTNTGSDPNYYAKYYYLDFFFEGVYTKDDWQTAGHSVRCIKD